MRVRNHHQLHIPSVTLSTLIFSRSGELLIVRIERIKYERPTRLEENQVDHQKEDKDNEEGQPLEECFIFSDIQDDQQYQDQESIQAHPCTVHLRRYD